MKAKSLILEIAGALTFFLLFLPLQAEVNPTGLQCKYLTNPLGIDVETPRFTWQLSDDQHIRGQKQSGYHILIVSSPALLTSNRGGV